VRRNKGRKENVRNMRVKQPEALCFEGRKFQEIERSRCRACENQQCGLYALDFCQRVGSGESVDVACESTVGIIKHSLNQVCILLASFTFFASGREAGQGGSRIGWPGPAGPVRGGRQKREGTKRRIRSKCWAPCPNGRK
jgi:hypothetical protein